MDNQTGGEPFPTGEAILALALNLAGCEPMDGAPCINIYDEDILFVYGGGKKDQRGNVTKASRFADMPLFDAATQAWEERAKGDVKFIMKLTPRCADLIRAYRDQCEQVEKRDDKAFALLLEIMESVKAGAMLEDEGILRVATVILKTRKAFVMHWKEVVPLLRVPLKGKPKHFDTTTQIPGPKGRMRTVQGKGVREPGFKTISLNASPELRKKLKI